MRRLRLGHALLPLAICACAVSAEAASRPRARAPFVATRALAQATPDADAQAGAGKFTVPYLSGPVIDEVGVFDAAARDRIDAALRSFNRQGKMQMVVYVPASLHGMDIADFSIRLGEAWKLGRKGQDQGLILVIAPNERKMRFEVGYGLEGTLTDAYTRHLLDDVLRPYFRERRYGDGVLAVIGEVATRLGVSAEVPAVEPAHAQIAAEPAPLAFLSPFLPLLLPLALFLFLRMFRRRSHGIFYGGGGWGGGWGGGFGGGGGGGGGGDFFGGGGGGFGGGGSSSDW